MHWRVAGKNVSQGRGKTKPSLLNKASLAWEVGANPAAEETRAELSLRMERARGREREGRREGGERMMFGTMRKALAFHTVDMGSI